MARSALCYIPYHALCYIPCHALCYVPSYAFHALYHIPCHGPIVLSLDHTWIFILEVLI